MKKSIFLAAAAVITFTATPAYAQASAETQSSSRDRIGAIFGALFGDRLGATTSIDSQWAAGQTPLANQRAQFESRVDTEVRTGTLNQATGTRVKSDYYNLVQLEARYGADGRFTTQERTDLADRYGTLTQVLVDGAYAGGGATATADVANGRAEFESRVNAALAARRITRTLSTRLKADYAAVAQIEAGYLRDGVISNAERADLDARLDALDVRLGDTAYVAPLTTRARLDAIIPALPASGLTRAAQNQLRIELGDVSRLEAAYARINPTAEELAYLEGRVLNLETRARIRR